MAYLVLLALAALDSAGYSIIAPVVPEIGDATGAGPGLMGALVASFAVGQMVGYPLAAFGFVTVLLQRLGSAGRTAAIIGALTAAMSYYVFGVLLDVPLPRWPWVS